MRNSHRCTALPVLFLLLITLSGCVHHPLVTTPYPRWGEETVIGQGGEAPLILRTLSPAQPDQSTACVLLVHGMNEHIGRYGEVARYFSRHFFVAGFDHYAHGLSNPVLHRADQALTSGAERVDVGDAYLAQSALYDLESLRQTFGSALQAFIAQCDAQGDPRRPVFIVAHSLGGLVTASYFLKHPQSVLAQRLQGVIFLAPAFAVSEPPGWRGWIANPLIKLSFHAETHFLHPHDEPLPLLLFNQAVSLVTVPVLDGLFEVFSWPGLRNFFTPISPAWVADYLTDSDVEKARLRADHWIVRRSLLRYVKGIEQEVVDFRRKMEDFSIPYYLIYSERDPITPAWGSEDFAGVTLKRNSANEIRKLPGLIYHQHVFLEEPLRTELLESIEQWIHRQMRVQP